MIWDARILISWSSSGSMSAACAAARAASCRALIALETSGVTFLMAIRVAIVSIDMSWLSSRSLKTQHWMGIRVIAHPGSTVRERPAA
ncbi:hypothetical protein GCM10022419_089040 [Nonomuraea rosea]|uniref:Secreted protein n=1 Tax=Nonomuraea rosea TaxID=638574 RepID=A0ABP6Z1A4_9ACTN